MLNVKTVSIYKDLRDLMAWTRWKAAEKEVAEALGGLRRIRVQYNESICDVIHGLYSIEVKYGKQIPKYCLIERPTLLVTNGSCYALRHSKDHRVRKVKVEVKSTVFLDKAFEQAKGYAPDKLPLVCLKARGMHGFIVVKQLRRCTLHTKGWKWVQGISV